MVTAPPPLLPLLLPPPKQTAAQEARIPEMPVAPTAPAEYLRKSRRESPSFLLLVDESLLLTSLVLGCVDMTCLLRAAWPSTMSSSRLANVLAEEDAEPSKKNIYLYDAFAKSRLPS